jgi:predicted nucleotidyltransferase
VHVTLGELVDAGVLESERVGTLHLFRVREGNLWVERVLAPVFEAEARIEDRLWRDLAQAAGAGLQSMVLFGSRARDDSRPGSDLDLLVVVADGASVDDVRYALLETGLQYGLSAEATMVPMCELPRWARRSRGLWENILAEGVAIAGFDLGELRLHVGGGEPRPGRGIPKGRVAQS